MNLRTLVPIGLVLVLASCGGERAAPGSGAEGPATRVPATPDTLRADTIMPRDTAQP